MSVNQAGGFFRGVPEEARPNIQLYFNPLSYRIPADAMASLRPEPYPGFLVAFDQAVIRDVGREMVDVVVADIDGEPVQPARQYQETRARGRSGVVIPVLILARIGVAEVVLHRE